MHETAIAPNPGKPLPQDVLRTLSDGVELGDILRKVSNDAAKSLSPEPTKYSSYCQNLAELGHVNIEDSSNEYSKYLKASDNIGTLLLLDSSSPNGATPGEKFDAVTKQFPADRTQISIEGPSGVKVIVWAFYFTGKKKMKEKLHFPIVDALMFKKNMRSIGIMRLAF